MKKNTIALLVAISALFSMSVLSGCRTMEGAGEDIERGGEEIQEAARR
jgi:predicted small secreted protein